MRILLTGPKGQVGSALEAPLVSLGTVLAADRTFLDLSCPSEIPRILDSAAPDLIVNPAAYTAVDQAESEPELAYCVNANAPGAMAKWSARNNVPMVHFSTDYVFSGDGERPWQENDRTMPLSVYGASKLAGELAIREAGGSHLIIRTSWVYSSRGKNFLNTILTLARQRTELRIVADQVGAPTSARSLAEGVISILRTTGQESIQELVRRFQAAGGLVHMSNSGETTWHGFACDIIAGLRRRGAEFAVRVILPITTPEFPTKAQRPYNSRLDLRRLEEVLGVRMSNWKVALDRELDKLLQV